MSFFSWNCRGLGDPQGLTVQRLTELRHTYFPEVLFLMETMNPRNALVDMQCWLGYDHVYTVDPVNTWGGGGSCSFLEEHCCSKNFVCRQECLGCKSIYEDKCFYVSCVYGNPTISLRHII